MRELIRSNDPLLISFATSVLTDAGIKVTVTDTHMNVIDGSIGAVSPRILVDPDQYEEARLLLDEAGVR
ncbi:MAG TPA: DUF2007 domain-containing protein [Pseudonocardiaceae bacterium]|jgi:hypothetical protein|nr:DUF2007 domain-containing protein [Pseudonocardiaceae bacterium]